MDLDEIRAARKKAESHHTPSGFLPHPVIGLDFAEAVIEDVERAPKKRVSWHLAKYEFEPDNVVAIDEAFRPYVVADMVGKIFDFHRMFVSTFPTETSNFEGAVDRALSSCRTLLSTLSFEKKSGVRGLDERFESIAIEVYRDREGSDALGRFQEFLATLLRLEQSLTLKKEKFDKFGTADSEGNRVMHSTRKMVEKAFYDCWHDPRQAASGKPRPVTQDFIRFATRVMQAVTGVHVLPASLEKAFRSDVHESFGMRSLHDMGVLETVRSEVRKMEADDADASERG